MRRKGDIVNRESASERYQQPGTHAMALRSVSVRRRKTPADLSLGRVRGAASRLGYFDLATSISTIPTQWVAWAFQGWGGVQSKTHRNRLGPSVMISV